MCSSMDHEKFLELGKCSRMNTWAEVHRRSRECMSDTPVEAEILGDEVLFRRVEDN